MNKNNYKYSSKKKSSKKKLWLLVLPLLVVAFGVLELTNTIHLFRHETPATQVIKQVGIKSTPVTNNSSANTPNTKTQSNSTTNTNSVPGGGNDTNGSSTASTPSSQWVTSTSGNITVKQPVVNSTLQSGVVLSGTAKVDTVNFRLIDNTVGVISQGTLNVVNGNFSGKINFTAQSSSGRLDVFSTSPSGVELNEVQIAVQY
jgi:cytoskeletal protein RodZ